MWGWSFVEDRSSDLYRVIPAYVGVFLEAVFSLLVWQLSPQVWECSLAHSNGKDEPFIFPTYVGVSLDSTKP